MLILMPMKCASMLSGFGQMLAEVNNDSFVVTSLDIELTF